MLVIALAALTGYLLICLFSYSSADPGWTSTGEGGPIRNLGGRFGAWFADLFLHAFGYSAYLFPLIFGLLSSRILKNRSEPLSPQVRAVHGVGLVLTVFSACWDRFCTSTPPATWVFGRHGLSLVAGGWLLDAFGSVGRRCCFSLRSWPVFHGLWISHGSL